MIAVLEDLAGELVWMMRLLDTYSLFQQDLFNKTGLVYRSDKETHSR